MAQGAVWAPYLLTFQEQGLQRNDPPKTSPIYTPYQKAYKCHWHKQTTLYARAGIHVNLIHHLSIRGRLSLYEVVGDGWQQNVINAHITPGDATRMLKQAFTVNCFDDIVLLMPLLAPAAH